MLSPTMDADARQVSAADFSAWNIAAIADLSDATLSRLTREELVQLYVAAAAQVRLASPPDSRQLQLRDTETLRRLARLAVFVCRNLIRCRSLNGQP